VRLTALRWLAIAIALTGQACTDPAGITWLTIYPKATVQIDRNDGCDVVTNITSQSLVIVPGDEAGWQAFAASGYPFVAIKKCQTR